MLGRRLTTWLGLAGAFAVILTTALVYAFIRSKGVAETGDEPHYLVTAKALTQFTIHPLKAYAVDVRTHRFFNWPAGTNPSTLELYPGPHGPVSDHPIGLSILLMPFVAFGERVARLGLMALEAASFVYLFCRAAGLAALSRRARTVFAVIIAGPAVWIAATQIYPDFPTGILIACAVVELIAGELGRRPRFWGTAVFTFSVALLPWMHQQDLIAAVLLLAGAAAVLGRHSQWRRFVVVAALCLASWALLLAYNFYAYGHAVGLPQPFPSLNGAGITEILGLLFDRHQGLFVQVPTVVIGLLGLWRFRRSAPVAATTTVLSVASLIYLNGTFIGAPYGGTSLAGRFEWSAIVPLLLWCPFLIKAIDRSRARTWTLAVIVGALWLLQSIPLLTGDHSYYNQLIGGIPWDMGAYPGWWGRMDRLLPVLIPKSDFLGGPWFALPLELTMLVLAAVALLALTRFDRGRVPSLAAGSVVAVAAIGVMVAIASIPLPKLPLEFTSAQLRSPYVASTSSTTVAVPLQGIQPGVYRIHVGYDLTGPAPSAALEPFCSAANLHGHVQPEEPRQPGVRVPCVVGNPALPHRGHLVRCHRRPYDDPGDRSGTPVQDRRRMIQEQSGPITPAPS